MENHIYFSSQHLESEHSLASKLLADSDFTDVTLVSDDYQHIAVHCAVLSASSIFFRSIFYSSLQQTMITHNVRATFLTTQALVNFIYLGHCNITKDNIAELFLLAQKWQIEIPRDNGTDVDKKSGIYDIIPASNSVSNDAFNSEHRINQVECSYQYFPFDPKSLNKITMEFDEINAEDIIFLDNKTNKNLTPLNGYKENEVMPNSDRIHSFENSKRQHGKRISKKPTNFITKISPNEDNLYICNKCDSGIYS